jgi:hypothetical protein
VLGVEIVYRAEEKSWDKIKKIIDFIRACAIKNKIDFADVEIPGYFVYVEFKYSDGSYSGEWIFLDRDGAKAMFKEEYLKDKNHAYRAKQVGIKLYHPNCEPFNFVWAKNRDNVYILYNTTKTQAFTDDMEPNIQFHLFIIGLLLFINEKFDINIRITDTGEFYLNKPLKENYPNEKAYQSALEHYKERYKEGGKFSIDRLKENYVIILTAIRCFDMALKERYGDKGKGEIGPKFSERQAGRLVRFAGDYTIETLFDDFNKIYIQKMGKI